MLRRPGRELPLGRRRSRDGQDRDSRERCGDAGSAVQPHLVHSQLQRKQKIMLDSTGAWLLGNRIHFSLLGNGNYIQGTRVPPYQPDSSPAIAAAVIRPGKQKSMNINDMHHAAGHRNAATLKETARQLGVKLTSLLEFCDFCAEAKGFKVFVPRSIAPHCVSTRPFSRLAIDLAGAYSLLPLVARGT